MVSFNLGCVVEFQQAMWKVSSHEGEFLEIVLLLVACLSNWSTIDSSQFLSDWLILGGVALVDFLVLICRTHACPRISIRNCIVYGHAVEVNHCDSISGA
jgi:hypothetical protein